MAIKVGDKVPSVTMRYLTPEGVKAVPSEEFFAGKKVVVFGLPGAYTRTCSSRHLPGYVTNADALRKKGIDAVACLSVNDAFVMDAWGKAQHVVDDQIQIVEVVSQHIEEIGGNSVPGAVEHGRKLRQGEGIARELPGGAAARNDLLDRIGRNAGVVERLQ